MPTPSKPPLKKPRLSTSAPAKEGKSMDVSEEEEEEEEEEIEEEESKTTVRRVTGLAKMQPIFSNFTQMTPELRQQIRGTQEMLQENFVDIIKEYEELVKEELSGEFKNWVLAPKKTNFLLENVKKSVKKIQKLPELFPKSTEIIEEPCSDIISIKPEKDPNGFKKTKVDCSLIEVGELTNRMNYWVPIEQSTVADDQLRLTHMPLFETKVNEKEMYFKLNKIFYDGIHGCSDNYSYINDWILYKLFLKSLDMFNYPNPDVFYYSAYRLWPNKLSQRELSFLFPDWCSLYSDEEIHGKEKWKKKESEYVYAENMQEPTCYSCLEYTCMIHGFKSELAPESAGGDFVIAKLPIPGLGDPNSTEKCSKFCYKSINFNEIDGQFSLSSDEIEAKQMEIYLDKKHISHMSKEEGGTILSTFQWNHQLDFCDFVKRAIDKNEQDEDEEEGINSCRGAYSIILKMAQNISTKRLNLGIPNPLAPKRIRVKAYRTYQKNRHKARILKRHQAIIKECEKDGSDPSERIAEDDKLHAETDEKVSLLAVTPFIPCRHSGTCATTEEYCSCRENGICSHLCKCDPNCPQKFPGCNCAPGQCQSQACECYRASWECNPITCKNCKCDSVDGEELKCRNFSMSRMLQKRMKVAPSRIAGNGLFIMENVEKDEFITEYVGERISDDEAERRGAIYDMLCCSYIFNLPIGGAIDSFTLGNMSRFANHDHEDPTVYARTVVVGGEHRIGFYARKALKSGDELLFDYKYGIEHQEAISNEASNKKSKKSKKKKEIRMEIPETKSESSSSSSS